MKYLTNLAVVLIGSFVSINSNAELCNGQILQPGGELMEMWDYTVEQRAEAIARKLTDGCANSTDLIGQKRFNAKWKDGDHTELVTTCSSSAGGRRDIVVTFDSYPYKHARYNIVGHCEMVIQNPEELQILRQYGR